jgi:arginase
LTGDCCTTIGVAAGLQRAGVHPTLVWLDAHGDFNTPETTPSGFIGGMPLAMLVGRGDQTLVEAAGMTPLAETAVYLSDARDLDPGEGEAVQRSAVHHVADLSTLPQQLPERDPLWVHLDVDVLDPGDAPAVAYPAPKGPSLEHVEAILGKLAATGRIVAVSVTAWDFGKDGDGRTERACRRLISALLGG